MGKRSPDKKKRAMNPKSLANLVPPVQPGEVRNPTGVNRKRPYSDANLATSTAVFPEALRLKMNKLLGTDFIPPKATWADAYSIRMHIAAIVDGNVSAAAECRESVEGRASQRIEVTGGDGKPLMAPSFRVEFVDGPIPEPTAPAVSTAAAVQSPAVDGGVKSPNKIPS